MYTNKVTPPKMITLDFNCKISVDCVHASQY